jgi:hypothetical protein
MKQSPKLSTAVLGGMIFIVAVTLSNDGSAADTYVVEKRVIVPPGQARNVTVRCKEGDLALSGGYRTGEDTVPSHFGPNRDENPDGWRFIFANPRPSNITSAYQVLCLK